MNKRLRLRLVEVQKGRGNFCCNLEAELPRKRSCARLAEDAIFKVAIGHVLIDQASMFRTGTHEENQVRMTNATQYLHLKGN